MYPQPTAPVYPPPHAAAPTYPPPAAPAPPGPSSYAPSAAGAAPAEQAPSCILGGFCIGPAITAGLLNVFGLGVHARMDYWGIGFDYQFIGLGYGDVDGDLSLLTIEGRVYPFANPFFLSLGVAWQDVALETTVRVAGMQDIPPLDVTAEGKVNLPLFKFGLGFMGRDGFVLGIDLGFGIRLSDVKVELQTNLPRFPEVVQAEAEIREAAESWIEWLPFTLQLNLIRIGYLF